MSFFSAIGDFIMTPLYYIISVVLVGWHSLWSQVFAADVRRRLGAVDRRA